MLTSISTNKLIAAWIEKKYMTKIATDLATMRVSNIEYFTGSTFSR
jgi:hypothetical protein